MIFGIRKFQHGTSTVEFSIVGGLFLLLILTMIDFAVFSFIKLTMQHAVREGARFAITGQAPSGRDGIPNRKEAINKKIRRASGGFAEGSSLVTDIEVTNINGAPISGFGSPGETIVIKIDCQWPSFSPIITAALGDGTYDFSVAATMRNEYFPTP